MRIVKKIIKKIYHLIWFLSLFLIFSNNVFAVEENTNIGDTNFYTPPYATFADVTNGYATRTEGTSSHNIYYAPADLVTSGNDYDGMGVIFTHESLFVEGYLYTVTLLVGFSSSSAYPKATSNKVCINHNLGDAIAGFNANVWCTTATTYTWDNVSPFTTYDGTQVYLGMISYIFVSPKTAKSFIGVVNSSVRKVGYQIFGGAYVEQLADNKTYSGLSAQDMHNILNNSGLASASSVSDVQRSVTQIQSDINTSSQNIINNNNQNTQDIIDNQNDNTQQQIESQKACKSVHYNYNKDSSGLTNGKYLSDNGSEISAGQNYITPYLKISEGTTVLAQSFGYMNTTAFCFYKKDKTLISCETWQRRTSITITAPSETYYIRSTIGGNTTVTINGSLCDNGNQIISDDLNDINDSLNNSSVDSSDDTLNSLKSNLPTNSVISDLLLLPVRLLQAIVNSLGGTCSSFSLGSLYGTNLTMPCIDLQSYLGSTIWTFIDLVFSGMFILVIRKKFIQIWENITNLRNGGNEVD